MKSYRNISMLVLGFALGGTLIGQCQHTEIVEVEQQTSPKAPATNSQQVEKSERDPAKELAAAQQEYHVTMDRHRELHARREQVLAAYEEYLRRRSEVLGEQRSPHDSLRDLYGSRDGWNNPHVLPEPRMDEFEDLLKAQDSGPESGK